MRHVLPSDHERNVPAMGRTTHLSHFLLCVLQATPARSLRVRLAIGYRIHQASRLRYLADSPSTYNREPLRHHNRVGRIASSLQTFAFRYDRSGVLHRVVGNLSRQAHRHLEAPRC